MTKDDLLFYNNLGIFINEDSLKIDEFHSFFYDAAVGAISIGLSVVYRIHYNDTFRNYLDLYNEKETKKLLHPFIDLHSDRLCFISIFALGLETIFVPTII